MASRVAFRTGAIDLDLLPRADKADAWRAIAADGFEVSELPENLHGRGTLFQTGAVTFTISDHPRQVFRRSRARSRRDGVDHIMCSMELTPEVRASFEGSEAQLTERRVTFWDLSRDCAKASASGRTLCLTMARDDLAPLLTTTDGLHGLTLGPDSFLADYLLLTMKALKSTTADTAPLVERATLDLIAASVRPLLGAVAAPAPSVIADVLLERARRIITARLGNSELSPDEIAATLGLSRTRLYELFEPSGGVSSYIREQRLLAAQALLQKASLGSRVGEIAFATGFRSESQFSRAFRRRFGISPGDARPERGFLPKGAAE